MDDDDDADGEDDGRMMLMMMMMMSPHHIFRTLAQCCLTHHYLYFLAGATQAFDMDWGDFALVGLLRGSDSFLGWQVTDQSRQCPQSGHGLGRLGLTIWSNGGWSGGG